jgi:zinc transporter ZupT
MPREPVAERLAPPVPQHVWEYSFPDRERNRYVSRSLGYVVLLNGAAALTLMAIVALNPESTSRRLAWAMLVFASGAMAGLLSSLFAYVRRLFAVSLPTHIFMRDFLRVSAIVMAVGAGAAFLTGMNMVSLTVPEGSTTRMKSKPEENSKPQNPAPSLTGNHVRAQQLPASTLFSPPSTESVVIKEAPDRGAEPGLPDRRGLGRGREARGLAPGLFC